MPSIFIVDDHDIVRFALEHLVGAEADLTVAGTASNLLDATQQIVALEPDLVICDMSLGNSRGLDTVRAIVAAQAERLVLVVSMHDQQIYAERVLALGAHGYVMKESAHAQLMVAVRAVLRGETWVSAAVTTQVVGRLRRHARGVAGSTGLRVSTPLTTRELEVLERMARGWTTKEIAFDLNLSPRTVDIHRASLKNKMGFRSGAELMAFAATIA